MPIACFLLFGGSSTTHRRDERREKSVKFETVCVMCHSCSCVSLTLKNAADKKSRERRLMLLNATLHSAEKKEGTSLHSCVSLANLPV